MEFVYQNISVCYGTVLLEQLSIVAGERALLDFHFYGNCMPTTHIMF